MTNKSMGLVKRCLSGQFVCFGKLRANGDTLHVTSVTHAAGEAATDANKWVQRYEGLTDDK